MVIPRIYQLPVAQEPASAKGRTASGARAQVNREEAASPTSAPPPGATPGAASAEQSAVVLAPTLGAAAAMHGTEEAAASERVATVRAQVKAGTYKIDREKLTERLVDEEVARARGGTKR